MAGIDPLKDPRGARWEARLQLPVLIAAWLAIPTVLLYFSSLKGWWAGLALGLAWSIWLVFVVEAAIMLTVVADRRAWARGHAFGLAIILATFPLLTSILEGLLAARALSSLQGVRILQVLYLAKAAKLIKSWMILRKRGRGPRNPALVTVAAAVCATALVGIGDRIVSGDKHPTPFHGAWDVASDLTVTALVAILAVAALATTLIARRRRRGPAAAAGRGGDAG
ncbi:MAG: hypothetical protein QOD86_2488 [Miltoncostaeaceae bacterium]|nr:hypothetical protein [Miltoncostaeaceae bacterium]